MHTKFALEHKNIYLRYAYLLQIYLQPCTDKQKGADDLFPLEQSSHIEEFFRVFCSILAKWKLEFQTTFQKGEMLVVHLARRCSNFLHFLHLIFQIHQRKTPSIFLKLLLTGIKPTVIL